MNSNTQTTLLALFLLGMISLAISFLPLKLQGCFRFIVFVVVLLALLVILPLAFPK